MPGPELIEFSKILAGNSDGGMAAHGSGPGPGPPPAGAGPPVPVAPAPLRLLGARRYAAAHRPPALGLPPGGPAPLFAPPLPPARPRSGASAAPAAHRCAVAVPAPARCLGLSAPAAARPSAAAPGPPPPRCGPCCGPARRGAPALALVAAVALACCGWASGPPSAVCGLPAFPWAVPGGGAPRVGPSRRLPSLVPRSVGGLVGLRAPGLPPGPPAGLRPAFSGPPARAWGRCWRSVGFGVFRACGRGGFRRLRARGVPPPAGAVWGRCPPSPECHSRRSGSRVKPGGCAALDPPPPGAADGREALSAAASAANNGQFERMVPHERVVY